jgi:hypothetical protein
MSYQLRVARPVSDLHQTCIMYCAGLGLHVLASFEDHQGFDGIMLGSAELGYHFEFTQCRHHPVAPAPTMEDLLVFYMPDVSDWKRSCANMLAAGFKPVASFNPYWDVRGQTYEDRDGYRIVLQNADWVNVAAERPD